MSEDGDLEDLSELFDGLVEQGQSANVVLSEFSGEISRLQRVVAATGRDVEVLETGLSRGLRKAFDGVFPDGEGVGCAKASRSVADANGLFVGGEARDGSSGRCFGAGRR